MTRDSLYPFRHQTDVWVWVQAGVYEFMCWKAARRGCA